MNEVYLLLGSNIDPEKNILLALEYLNCNFKIIEVSNTWQTKPVGSNANDFLNTAVQLETDQDAYTLKEKCLCHIEEVLGRVRQADKNAPRTIDLDIILFNGEILDSSLFKFAHLILPFSELLPDLADPQSGLSLSQLAVENQKLTLAKKFKCLLPPFQK
jgi:2-amino-4-hydroxy-6-hydroxymethyldihydropteridine diphosphokinase